VPASTLAPASLLGHVAAHLSQSQEQPLQIIRRSEVLRRCGFKKSTLYLAMAERRFPRAIHLGPRAVGWLAHEIDQWIASRVAESRPDEQPSSALPVR
jgi:prophage regulatory protein